MLDFQVAYCTRPGRHPRHEAVVDGRLSPRPEALRLLALVRQPENLEALGIPLPLPRPPESLEAQLSAVGFDIAWRAVLDPAGRSLAPTAQPGVLHFFRLADATLIPLPPAYPPARHAPLPGRPEGLGQPLRLAPGDAYVAVSPGAARLTDSPALAGFLHLRDSFNAERLAAELAAHLDALAGAGLPPEDVTALVVEAR